MSSQSAPMSGCADPSWATASTAASPARRAGERVGEDDDPLVGMPESSAAWRLPPKASSCRPDGSAKEKQRRAAAATISGGDQQAGKGAEAAIAEGDEAGGIS